MTKEQEIFGYKGEALKAIRKADAEIGDIIRIAKDNQIYEGILIPRSEYGDENHIVIKLESGYNIGTRISPTTKITKIGKGAKPAFTQPSLPIQNTRLPRVAIVSTGGTIASRVDYRTGAVRPALTASDLYSVVPELTKIAQIDAQILFSLLSENITPKHWTEIAKTISKKISEGANGIVVAHGTDTMGYTAAALSFSLQDLPVPVILVGSQRSADRPSSDAAANLIGAVTAAAKAPFAEIAVAMHETISDTSIILHRGAKTRKCHTSRRDAFKSVNAASIARVQNQKVTMLTRHYRQRDPKRKLTLKPKFEEKVALIKFYPSMDPTMISLIVKNGYRGIILEGTGLGHVSRRLCEALQNAIEHDVVVGMTSQCIWGRVNMNVYDQGRDLLQIGVIALQDMLPETALVKLMWIFGQTKDSPQAKELLKTNIAGEMSPRTALEEQGKA